jgi:hypothetical protein
MSPVVEMESPVGIFALTKEMTGRSDFVVAVSWMGVMGRFWMKES